MDREPRWTRTHAFFLLMGGFHVYKRPDRELKPLNSEEDGVQPNYQSHDDETFVHILEPHNLLEDNLEYTLPTEQEIEDKGKSDGITKAIVLLQTSWFVVQCIARGIRHLPLTELEVVTLAYTMVNFFIYLFWWYKPRDVGCPLRVYKTSTAEPTPAGYTIWGDGFTGIVERVFIYLFGMQDEYATLSGESQVPMFWSGGSMASAGIAALAIGLIGAVFGSIHFVAWSYGFPSEAELILWRMTCIFITAIPLATPLIIIFVSRVPVAPEMVQGFMFLSVSLYIIARILSLIVAFTTLRSLPADAFRVVDWTTFIPHI